MKHEDLRGSGRGTCSFITAAIGPALAGTGGLAGGLNPLGPSTASAGPVSDLVSSSSLASCPRTYLLNWFNTSQTYILSSLSSVIAPL